MSAEPQQFGGGEARHGDVACDLAQRGEVRFQLGALGGGTGVVPENGGAQWVAGAVEADGAVHLPGEADRLGGGEFSGMGAVEGVKRVQGGLPPCVGVLLGPAGAWGAGR